MGDIMSIRYSELKKKDVLNVETGKNLGKISDLIIEKSTGKVLKIVVNGKRNCFIPCDGEEIEYCKITKIGDDAILITKSCSHKQPCVEVCKNQKSKEDCFDFDVSEEDE